MTSDSFVDRWPVTARLLAVALVAFMAIGAVGAVSFTVIARQRTALDSLAELSRAQRVLQDADLEHDAIRADVLAIDNSWTRQTPEQLRQKLDRDIDQYRTFLTTAAQMRLPDDLRQSIAGVEPDLDTYLHRALDITRVTPNDPKATSDQGAAFEESFERLSITNRKLTDLFASRVAAADANAARAASASLWAIAVTAICALIIVGFTCRVALQSIARALGRVRAAAEAISDGNLSVRSRVAVNDDIGAVAGAVNRMADTLQTIIGRLQAEQEQDAFSRQLSEVLEMADTEADTFQIVARGMAAVAADMPMELLLADSSRAHLEQAIAHPGQGAPGCGVASPFGCMAVRRGNPIVFDDSEALNACGHLRGRAVGSISAVCVPLSFMGRALGVLHATGPAHTPPAPNVVSQLTTLGILTGSRIGTVRAFERTQVQARTDSLTGLANRRAFESRVRALGSQAAYAFILADLDHFKRLNDKHGHEAGDRALRLFADVLRQSLRENDIAARWGGEEFAILLEGHDALSAMDVVTRLRTNMAAGLQGAPAVTASFGIADTTMAGSLEDLVRIADDALYDSKEAGRDRGTIGSAVRAHRGSMPRRTAEHLASVNMAALADLAPTGTDSSSA